MVSKTSPGAARMTALASVHFIAHTTTACTLTLSVDYVGFYLLLACIWELM